MQKTQYIRKIESMGKELLLLEVYHKSKTSGLLYHKLFSNDRSPSLDVAINPLTGELAYVRHILQDEKFLRTKELAILEPCSQRICLPNEEITVKNHHSWENAVFLPWICDSTIGVLRKDLLDEKYSSYAMDDNNGLLFHNEEFAGFILKNISDCELAQMMQADSL